jgi:hypothetical protein
MSATFTIPSNSFATGIAATEPPGVQLMMAPFKHPDCGGCTNLGASIWLDDVTVAKSASW